MTNYNLIIHLEGDPDEYGLNLIQSDVYEHAEEVATSAGFHVTDSEMVEVRSLDLDAQEQAFLLSAEEVAELKAATQTALVEAIATGIQRLLEFGFGPEEIRNLTEECLGDLEDDTEEEPDMIIRRRKPGR